MDFVSDLPDSGDALEIAFDDLGRAEFLNGRLRLTFYREVMRGDGSISRVPSVALVCTNYAWSRARRRSPAIIAMIEEMEALQELASPSVAGSAFN